VDYARIIIIIGCVLLQCSTVLTAISLSYVKKQRNSTLHKFKTPQPIETKFGIYD